MKKFKKIILICSSCFILTLALAGCSDSAKARIKKVSDSLLSSSNLSSVDDLNLEHNGGGDYSFDYAGEEFNAMFDTDTWTIYNSYKIKNGKDILLICQALSDEHPVPSRDRDSYRTPEDMAFEWEQHNLAYDQLPDGNYWKESSRNVDLDPDDQGKSFKEIYEDRTGKTLDFDKIKEKALEKLDKDKIREKLNSEKIKEKLNSDKIKEKLKSKNIKEKLTLSNIKRKLKEYLEMDD